MKGSSVASRRGRGFGDVVVWLCASLLIGVIFVALFADFLAPFGIHEQNLGSRLMPPGTEGHLLGTDHLGRDVLSRLIHGARLSLAVGGMVMVLTAALGVAIGFVSGYFGGWIDTVTMRIVDIWLAFPFLLMAVALVAVLGRGLDKLVIALVISGWPAFARPVRAEVMQLRQREYVLSANALGASTVSTMVGHLLPNVMPTILVLAALDLGASILALASLSFLGMGMGAEVATWGGMLSEGRAYVVVAWWLALFPGLAIFAVVLSSNLIGDWIRDRYDPRSPFRRARGGPSGDDAREEVSI